MALPQEALQAALEVAEELQEFAKDNWGGCVNSAVSEPCRTTGGAAFLMKWNGTYYAVTVVPQASPKLEE